MSAPPRIMQFRWDGRAMIPLHPGVAARQYEAGETYRLEVREERSPASHNHFFAVVTEGWQNLPEHLSERFPTPDHLRRWLLIKAGYHDERSIPAPSQALALRIAAFVRPMDDYAVVIVREATVSVFTAKSQSMRAMGKQDFQQSKEAVLDALAALIEVERRVLEANAGRAA